MTITIFQALTLLAKEYRDNPEIYAQIKSIYLSGVKSPDDMQVLMRLLESELLMDYEFASTGDDINNDPVRRYFESHLCHKTLAESLDALDYNLLSYHYLEVLNEIKTYGLWTDFSKMCETPSRSDSFYNIRMENAEGIRVLNLPDSYQSLKPKHLIDTDEVKAVFTRRKNKLLLLAKTSFASWYYANALEPWLPLNIYSNSSWSHYNETDRGRQIREGQTVKSQTYGIMRSYMPLPQDDALRSKQPSRYLRPADQSTYVPGAKQPDVGFRTLVSPFSNSISGTMLTQLKVMAKFVSTEFFNYSGNEAQLKLYFKTYIAYMIYHSGGHSLDEYMRVFQLPEVKEAFASATEFANIELETLFKIENDAAFESALTETVAYCEHILRTKHVARTLKAVRTSPDLNDRDKENLTPRITASHEPRAGSRYTVGLFRPSTSDESNTSTGITDCKSNLGKK